MPDRDRCRPQAAEVAAGHSPSVAAFLVYIHDPLTTFQVLFNSQPTPPLDFGHRL